MLRALSGDYAVRLEPLDDLEPYLRAFDGDKTKYAFALQLKALLTFCDPPNEGVTVYERSPLATRYVFGHVLRNEGHFSQYTWDLFKGYHDALSWTPDLIIYVDTPPAVCLERARTRGRDYEKNMHLDYLENIAHQYEHMMKTFENETRIVDGTRPLPEVIKEVRDILGNFLSS